MQCGGCGSTDYADNWRTFDIEFSPGLTGNQTHINSMLTRNFMLCESCYMSPAAGIIRNAVSDKYARPVPEEYGCITLCSKPRKVRLYRNRVRRKRMRCPGCYGISWVYWIYHDETPRIMGRLREAIGV